jgi:hypothetical protein
VPPTANTNSPPERGASPALPREANAKNAAASKNTMSGTSKVLFDQISMIILLLLRLTDNVIPRKLAMTRHSGGLRRKLELSHGKVKVHVSAVRHPFRLTLGAFLPYSCRQLMNIRLHRGWWVIRCLLAVVCCATSFGCAATALFPPSLSVESRKLDAIFESYFEAYLKLFPTFATEIGDHRYDDRLEIAISEEHIAAQKKLVAQTLDQLARIELARLDGRGRFFHGVLRYNVTDALESFKFKQHLLPVRQLASLAVEFPLLGSGSGIHPFKTVADYDNFLKRIKAFETWIDTAIGNMRRGMELGIVAPRAVIERTLPQIEAMIVDEPKASLLYHPILHAPDHFSAAERDRLARAFTSAIEQTLLPVYRD